MAIGVSPKSFTLKASRGEEISRKIFLQNLGSEPAQVTITAEKSKNEIFISPAQTFLPPDEIVPITVLVKGGRSESAAVHILTRENENQSITVGSGIKIPVEISVRPEPFQIAAALAMAIFVFVFVFYRMAKR